MAQAQCMSAPAVALPGTERRTIRARSSGGEYRIMIAHPVGAAPSTAGYPVLYMLDGNAGFATAAEAVFLRSRRPEVTGVAPAVVVGIGYPTDDPLDPVRRAYDYTPPAALLRLPPRPDGTPWPPTGGADQFLDFIVEDLKPSIGRDFPIDGTRQALFGHSFGGLFALHTLFTRPRTFQHYVAASPSIWWNECALLDGERAFAAVRPHEPHDLDVMITVGAREQELVPVEAAGPDREQRAQWKRQNRMVDNAREMAARLATLAEGSIRVIFHEFEGEDHVSVIPAAISRAIGFALAGQLGPKQ
jgi:predicted alpha/beta superfamily hydrolase